MVPHLVTALNGPINELEQRVLDSMPAIERWFRLEWMEHTPPFYTSVDVRNSGFKLAPVDTNLFPSGWNNLTPEMLPLAVQAAMAAMLKMSFTVETVEQIWIGWSTPARIGPITVAPATGTGFRPRR